VGRLSDDDPRETEPDECSLSAVGMGGDGTCQTGLSHARSVGHYQRRRSRKIGEKWQHESAIRTKATLTVPGMIARRVWVLARLDHFTVSWTPRIMFWHMAHVSPSWSPQARRCPCFPTQ